ncbi:MAG: hypothetical protein ACE5DI_04825 [Candidatus Micrarchaeia archaeon]
MPEKRVTVKLLQEAKDEYLSLKNTVQEEKLKGVKSSCHQTLLNSINAKIEILKINYDYGSQIPKRLIPRKYREDYEVTNLWKVNLSGYWRMVYTIKQPQRERAEVDVISIWLDILDIIDHKKYDKTFGYRKK